MITRRELLQFAGITTGLSAISPLLSGCAVDPVTGRQQLVLLSEAEEINLDKTQSPHQFSADSGTVNDPKLNQYLQQTGMRLASISHRPHMPFSFRAVNASYINAYAFPGGSIAATRGILIELENEAELAALLGHEIGHVTARHSAEQATKGLLANVVLAGATVAAGVAGYQDAAGLLQGLGGLGAGALLARYSRDNEHEADNLGMQYMVEAGYSPKGMVNLMEVLLKNSKHRPNAIELMFATHPMSDERFNIARNRANNSYGGQLDAPMHRERYLDNTVGLRAMADTIHNLQKAETAFQKKQYDNASDHVTTALRQTPDDYAALLLMSKCRLAMDQPGKAEQYAARAIEAYPEEAQAHAMMGICSMSAKRYAMAVAQFDRYESLLPGNPDIIFFKGLAREGMDNTKDAAQQYARYLRMVNRGQKAQYAYDKLKTWGYLQQPGR